MATQEDLNHDPPTTTPAVAAPAGIPTPATTSVPPIATASTGGEAAPSLPEAEEEVAAPKPEAAEEGGPEEADAHPELPPEGDPPGAVVARVPGPADINQCAGENQKPLWL